MFTVGIDLGTTASVVSFIRNGKPCAIPIDSGKKTTPSVVNYSEDTPIVGREAVFKVDSAHTVFSVKRHMGTDFRIFGKSPEEISADILSFLKVNAESRLREKIDGAVITVPAHFSELQRIATKRAASIAGIKVLRLISEPAAAAIAFGLDRKSDGLYAVYDLGGGTFDLSILRLQNGVFQVLATGGDNYLGGDDIDAAILEYNCKQHGIDMSQMFSSEKMLGRLITRALKEALGTQTEARKNFVYRNKKYEFRITKDEIAKIASKFIDRTFAIADQVFKDAGVSPEKVDGIVLVGGMTRLQYLKDSVKKHFSVKIYDDISPEEVVSLGAAIQAESITSQSGNMLLIDVAPLTLGVETFGGGVDKIIHRNTPIPVMQRREYTTYQDNQTGISFHIVQGERAFAADCRSIAKFELQGIPRMPAGFPRVIVEFSIDVNGLLSVKASEKTTGISQSIIVEPSVGLTDAKMRELLENALKNKEEDDLKASYLFVKIDSERKLRFWNKIIDEIPKKKQKSLRAEMKLLKESLADEDYYKAFEHKKKLENMFGEFIDDIIRERFSKTNINDFVKEAL